MERDATKITKTEKKKKYSFYCDEEEIDIKPSIELIADEYGRQANDRVLLHVFNDTRDQDVGKYFLGKMRGIGYDVNPDDHMHIFKDEEQMKSDLELVKRQTPDKDALILVFIGNFKDEGTFSMFNKGSVSSIEAKHIWNAFTADACPALKNKPKIFLFCATKQIAAVFKDSVHSKRLHFDRAYDFPTESDILIIYKRIDDLIEKQSDAFFADFCSNIEKFSKNSDIIDLVMYSHSDTAKCLPLVISTLTRKFYLTPSTYRDHHLTLVEFSEVIHRSLATVQSNMQMIQDNYKPKKEKKSLLASFKRMTEQKPKIVKKTIEENIVERDGAGRGAEPPPSRRPSGLNSPIVSARRRLSSVTSNPDKRKTSTGEKPRWKN